MPTEPEKVYSEMREARKILAVDLGFLGDTVHLVPALWELERAYPGAALHVLSSKVGAEVAELVPCVDRAWGIEMHSEKRTLGEQIRILRALRRERFDLAFNFSGADRGVFLTWLSAARRRVSAAAGRPHIWNSWLIHCWLPRQAPAEPAYEQKRGMLRACGLALQQTPAWDLRIHEGGLARAQSLVPDGGIHLSINASSPLKEWPLAHWAGLAKTLLASWPELTIVATGTPSAREQDRLNKLAGTVNNGRLKALPAGLRIAELAAVLRRCRLHIGGDSGVLHLAMAVGTPTISLFRQYEDAKAWMPSGPAHCVLSVPCECVNQLFGPCPPEGPAQCLERIEPAQVARAVEELLRVYPNPAHLISTAHQRDDASPR